MSETDLLSLEGVNSFYGAAHILHGMSLRVGHGEKVALIGRNGVGKTTVVNTILGIASLRSGKLSIAGKAYTRPQTYVAANHGVAVVPQGRQIIPNLTVEENLLLGAAVRRKGPWTKAQIFDLFPILRERASTPGTSLSGGQQQMLAIGRALMSNPSLILLDEPTEGLAPVIVDQLADVFNRVAREGVSLLLIEQNMSLVIRVASRFCAMAKGSVIAEGRVDATDLDGLHHYVMV